MHRFYSILKRILFLPLLLFVGVVIAQPSVNLGADTILCGPATYTLDAGNAGATFLWNTGEQTQTLLVDSSAFYIVTVTDGGGSTSDTIYVGFAPDPQTPGLVDTTFCGPGTYQLVAQNNGGTVFWYDSSGQHILGVGDTLTSFLDTQTSFKAEARGVVDTSTAGFSSLVGAFFGIVDDRGLFFDVKMPILLGTVDMEHQGQQSAEIQLYDPSNTLIYSQAIQLVDGLNTLPIYQNLPTGQGYRLMLANLGGGGNVRVQLPVTYPFDYETILITTGTPVANHYNYFTNWQIYIGADCSSTQDSMVANVSALPVVDLGEDTVQCGIPSLVLDAGNSGSTFAWNTFESTQTITVTGSGFYDVTVTNPAGCFAADSIYVGFAPNPVLPTVSDTVFCGEGIYDLVAQSNGGTVFWYDSAGQTVLSVGDTFQTEIQGTSQFVIEARGIVDTASAGFSNVLGAFFAITNDRGMIFDVKLPIVLGTVEVAHQGTQTADLQLFASDNTLLYSASLTLTDGVNEIPIYTELPTGTGYRLMLNNLGGGGSLNVQLPIVFPIDYQTITFVGGTPIANHYNYFYNWRTFIAGGGCQSLRDTMQASISPLPEVNIGSDTVYCNVDSVILDAGNPGSTYLWNDNSDTQTLIADSSAFYTVTVTNVFGCESADTAYVGLTDIPGSRDLQDTSFCVPGAYELIAPSGGGKLFWYDINGQNLLAIGDTLALELAESSQVVGVAQGLIPGSGAGRLVPSGGFFAIVDDRGMIFNAKAPIVLEKVNLEVQGQLSATVVLYDGQGTQLYSRFFEFADGNNELFLGFSIPTGQGYRIMLEGLSGGGAIPVNLTNTYPLIYPLVDMISGTPIAAHYNYFYDWQISIGGLCMADADTMNINIALPIDLPDSVYSCSDTVLDAGLPTVNYLWSTTETTSSIQINETGEYSVIIDDGGVCQLFDTTFVEIPVDAGLPDDGVLCGNTLTTNYGPDAIFDWNTGDSTATIDVNTPGTYSVTVYEPRGCVLTDTVVITGFDTFPVVDLGADLSECDSVILGAGNDPGLSYLWSTGDTTPQITVYASGTYSVAGANTNNCTTADTVGVLITPVPTADFFFVANNFTVNFINLSTFATPMWDFGDGNTSDLWAPAYTYQDTGTYTVQLIVSNICGSDTFTQEIRIETALGINPAKELASLKLYPNPSEGVFQVEVSEWPDQQLKVQVLDTRGRIIKDMQENRTAILNGYTVDMRGIPPGIYFVRLQSASGQAGRMLRIR
ncbi:MAG: PKD domain-containing protein [Bacteroidota bacterium]